MMVMLNMNVYRIMLIRMEEKHKSKISVYIGHIFFYFYNSLQIYNIFSFDARGGRLPFAFSSGNQAKKYAKHTKRADTPEWDVRLFVAVCWYRSRLT